MLISVKTCPGMTSSVAKPDFTALLLSQTLRSHRRLLPTQCHQHDLGRDAETKWHDAAAEAAGDDDVAIHADAAIGETLPRYRDRTFAPFVSRRASFAGMEPFPFRLNRNGTLDSLF